jgi:hypothetical protein
MKFRPLFYVMVAALSACGGDDGISIDQFPSRYADAACANVVTCKKAPDVATCKASIQIQTRAFETLVAKVKAKTIKYDASKASACISFIESASCSFTGFHSQPVDPCPTVFTGTVAAGGACIINEECGSNSPDCTQTDSTCDPTTTCCAGTCGGSATPPLAALGSDCTNADCVDTAYCDSTKKCAAPIAMPGAACTEIDACANPMLCDLVATNHTCITPAAHGATCDPMALLPCSDERDYCDTTTKTCTSNVAVGQACGGSNGAQCIAFSDCTNMLCVNRPAPGGTCTVDPQTQMGNCLNGNPCTNGQCMLPPPEAACTHTQKPSWSHPQDETLPPRGLGTKPNWMPTIGHSAWDDLRALR